MKILRVSDKISLSSQGVEVVISPLTQSQKIEILSTVTVSGGKEQVNSASQAMLTLKYCVKEVKGLETFDDSEYELEFDGNVLTDNCASDLIGALSQVGVLESVANASLGLLKAPSGVTLRVNGKEVSSTKK